MRLVTESGLWVTGPSVAPVPLAAVLELDGAVLAWTVDEAADAPPQITFTDPGARTGCGACSARTAIGAGRGHRRHGARAGRPGRGRGARRVAGSLRRLALGHWLRRWWPASIRDGIAGLNPAVLDAEIAVATAGADEFLGDDTGDSDIAALLAPHAGSCGPSCCWATRGWPSWCAGVPSWPTSSVSRARLGGTGRRPGRHGAGTAVAAATGSRDDYALAAGRGGDRSPPRSSSAARRRWPGAGCPAGCSTPRRTPSTGSSPWPAAPRLPSFTPMSSAPDHRSAFRLPCSTTHFGQRAPWTDPAAPRWRSWTRTTGPRRRVSCGTPTGRTPR